MHLRDYSDRFVYLYSNCWGDSFFFFVLVRLGTIHRYCKSWVVWGKEKKIEERCFMLYIRTSYSTITTIQRTSNAPVAATMLHAAATKSCTKNSKARFSFWNYFRPFRSLRSCTVSVCFDIYFLFCFSLLILFLRLLLYNFFFMSGTIFVIRSLYLSNPVYSIGYS